MLQSRLGSSGIGRAVLVCALGACGGTHTGNPGNPDGAQFVRSSLALETEPDVSQDERAQLTRDNRDFAFDLYAELAATRPGENVSISPYSISVALAMTYAGAAGTTQAEMETALHFALPEPALHRAFNARTQALLERGEHVSIVNASFADKTTTFHDEYLDVLALNYDAGMYLLDFRGDPNGARESINDWVSDKTQDRISDLLPDGAITNNTRLVLADAVHFKADWAAPFDANKTKDRTFHAALGDVTVKMMTGSSDYEYDYEYAEGDGYQALAIPFEPGELRMLFVLPSEGRFDEVEASLDRAMLEDIEQNLSATDLPVFMPRFSFESEFELSSALMALGMNAAFGAADFSRMSDASLRISAVHHKTFVAVAENGVEAAAATAVVIRKGADTPPVELVFDRPFFFAIYDKPTGALLFLGRLSDPS